MSDETRDDRPEPDAAAPETEADPLLLQAQRIEELEAELAAAQDERLRALAEAENARRRAAKDRDDAAKYGAAGLARDLLNVADNLRRAIESVPAERREGDEAFRSLVEGVEMVERELLQAFGKHAIRRVEAAGERFDHNLHQAVFEVPTAEHPPGHVAQVLQIGYVMHDRLLRPAMVGVAKAPEGEAPGDADGESEAPPRRADTGT